MNDNSSFTITPPKLADEQNRYNPCQRWKQAYSRKNIKYFHGRPIISYAIAAAMESTLFDRILVSTDCEQIAEVARNCGAEVPFLRSHEAANNTASMAQAIVETLARLANGVQCYKQVCCLFATAPSVNAKLIVQAQIRLSESDSDSVIVVQRNPNSKMRSLTMMPHKCTGQKPRR